MLAENPPPPHHAVVEQFASIGIGPGLDVEAQPDAVKQSLARAAAAGMTLLRQQLTRRVGHDGQRLALPPRDEGRFGDGFLRRAADQSLAGIAANDPAEAVYLMSFQDAGGAKLAPQGRYDLHSCRPSTRSGPLPPTPCVRARRGDRGHLAANVDLEPLR
jgi:hypothetical protein